MPDIMFRSTKGASKQRRDQINNEIATLRDLLPLPESSRQRLSQLQVMSLACVFIRKCNYITRLFGGDVISDESSFSFASAMSGFLLIVTKDGKMLYISDNVTEYLGHSMVDLLTQGDSLYDIVDKRDHSAVQAQLLNNSFENNDERTFFCRMNVARSFRRHSTFGDHKVMHVRGHFIQPTVRDHFGNQPVFMALCSPLITPEVKESVIQNNTLIFRSIHSLDMKFIEVALNGEHHLGYTDEEMKNKSWYELLHPEDVADAREKHIQLIKSSHEMGCMLTIRLLSRDGGFIWANVVMHIRQSFISDNGEPAIVCINQVISDSEAAHFKLQSQTYSSQITPSPEHLPPQSSPVHPQVNNPVVYDQSRVSLQLTAKQECLSVPMVDYMLQAPPPYQQVAGPNHQGIGSSSSHESLSDCSTGGSPISPNVEAAKERLLTSLKRKVDFADGCSAAKIPRFFNENSTNDGGHGGSMNTFNLPVTFDILNNTVGCMYDVSNVTAPLSQVHSKQPYLNKAMLVDIDDSVVPQTMGTVLPSPSVYSPSAHSPRSPDHDSKTSVDCTSQVKVPSSILTPDPSPNYMNSSKFFNQIDVESLMSQIKKVKTESSVECLVKPPVQPSTAQVCMSMVNKVKKESKPLPVLDPDIIDTYFDLVIPEIEPNVEVKQESQETTSESANDVVETTVHSPASSFADSLIDLATKSPHPMDSPLPASPNNSLDVRLEMWAEDCWMGLDETLPLAGTIGSDSHFDAPSSSPSYGGENHNVVQRLPTDLDL
ncbi:unnamed protein product [Owenia fusiformis]|uniref:Uncharacterized protein n=1 Tax=Owenia fusiformis TaxID=6347 RepID=A0A8S4PGJ9_OWEFU|nr:unnamed protein product [Owenia fusiformis]